MSYLLGMSFDLPASPALRFKAPRRSAYQHRQPFGWGIAWYPEGDQSAVVLKDPTALDNSAMANLLKDWKRFRSSVFFTHIQGAAKRRTQQDTHPFSKLYARRTWLLAHTGDLTHDFQQRLPIGDSPTFEPIGRTDSEYVFCWLLGKIAACGARTLGQVGWERLHGWLREINTHGTANLMLSDGLDLIVYRDADGFGSLCWTRRTPPHASQRFENEALVLDLDDPMNMNQTMCLFSTTPLARQCAWLDVEPGGLLVARRGALRWSSYSDPVTLVRATRAAPPAAPAEPEPAPMTEPTASLDTDDAAPESPAEVTPASTTHVELAAPPAMTSAALSGAESPDDAESPSVDDGLPPDGGDMDIRHRVLPPQTPAPRLLRIFHETTYTYQDPIEQSTHLLRLRPVDDHHQRLLSYQLDIDPHGIYSEFDDVFGNWACRLDFEEPYQTMRIRSQSLVRLQVPTRLSHSFSNHHDSIPLVWMPWDRAMMHPYLLPPELPVSQLRALSAYAMSFVERQDHDLIETLLDINRTIYHDYAYVPGSTTLATTPFEVFVNRRGVCQDFANLFICLARLLNIPARYRVGYIHTGADYTNTIQSEASHAWAELYLPLTGWRGFDPTNGCLAGQDHIRVACGRNYRDATPTSGTIYRGGGGERLNVDVRVEEVPDDEAQALDLAH